MPLQKKKKSYQSFPDQAGGSHSFDKLTQLRLPPLAGRSFLDVGCNEGFFCGFAHQQKASRAVGIDMNAGFLKRAQQRFPQCEFLNQTWDVLPEGPFDVILLASAVHYADDQPALIKRLVDHLSPDGTLVLELGIFSSPENEWKPVKRSIDTRYFPTMAKLKEVLEPFAWKYVGKSVNQDGDPVNRFVIHIRRRRPFAFLLMLPSSYGKTYIANNLFPKAGIPIVMGDVLLDEISKGKLAVSEKFKAFMAKSYKKGEVARVMRELLAVGLADDFVSSWAGSAAGSDIAFDGFVPEKSYDVIRQCLFDRGYFPVAMNWNLIGQAITSLAAAKGSSQDYFEYLRKTAPVPTVDQEPKAVAPKSQSNMVRDWKTDGQMGFVDNVKVHDGEVTISGWALDTDGKLPKSLVVELRGRSFTFDDVTATRRADVQKVFGLDHANVGFNVKLKVETAANEIAIARQISVKAAATGTGQAKTFGMAPRLRGQA